MYRKVFEKISHWHEHEIHDHITGILGYDTWMLGSAIYVKGRQENEEIDLLIEFPCREDYEKCVAVIVAILEKQPE